MGGMQYNQMSLQQQSLPPNHQNYQGKINQFKSYDVDEEKKGETFLRRDAVKMRNNLKKHKSGHDINTFDLEGDKDGSDGMFDSFYSNWNMTAFA